MSDAERRRSTDSTQRLHLLLNRRDKDLRLCEAKVSLLEHQVKILHNKTKQTVMLLENYGFLKQEDVVFDFQDKIQSLRGWMERAMQDRETLEFVIKMIFPTDADLTQMTECRETSFDFSVLRSKWLEYEQLYNNGIKAVQTAAQQRVISVEEKLIIANEEARSAGEEVILLKQQLNSVNQDNAMRVDINNLNNKNCANIDICSDFKKEDVCSDTCTTQQEWDFDQTEESVIAEGAQNANTTTNPMIPIPPPERQTKSPPEETHNTACNTVTSSVDNNRCHSDYRKVMYTSFTPYGARVRSDVKYSNSVIITSTKTTHIQPTATTTIVPVLSITTATDTPSPSRHSDSDQEFYFSPLTSPKSVPVPVCPDSSNGIQSVLVSECNDDVCLLPSPTALLTSHRQSQCYTELSLLSLDTQRQSPLILYNEEDIGQNQWSPHLNTNSDKLQQEFVVEGLSASAVEADKQREQKDHRDDELTTPNKLQIDELQSEVIELRQHLEEAEKKIEENKFLQVGQEYLKNVILKYIEYNKNGSLNVAASLLPVIYKIINVNSSEMMS